MSARVLPFLLLVACSGVQGIPVPPRAPSFSPTLDAPITVGQPGYIGPVERLPRGESKRVLPPAKEPGIWASTPPDGPPMRTRGSPIPTIDLLGFAVPIHEELRDGLDAAPAEHCAYIVEVDLAMSGGALLARAYNLTTKQRECLSASAHYKCLRWLDEAYRDRGDVSEDVLTSLIFSMHSTIRWIQKACPKNETDEVTSILRALESRTRPSPPRITQ